MERYENIIKIEEIRRLADDNQYVKALNVLKTLDTKKIKSLTDLSIIADVYTQNEEYDDAMNILTRIYAKNKTRRIVYQLVDLSIKRGDIYESEYYLDKYKKLASKDSYQYIFRYCIDKLKQEPYDVLIESLERLKEYEYFEVWAYELAKLYHKAGMKDRCVRECSDIILWFGNGIYVEKARLLKAYYVGEVNPIQMLKAKEKKATEMRLGLDKTKDYSNIRSEIDKFLAEADKEESNSDNIHNENKVIPFVAEDDYGVREITDGIIAAEDNEDSEEKELVHIWDSYENVNPEVQKSTLDSKEIASIRDSAYEELYSAGVFSESYYEEEDVTEYNIKESEEDMSLDSDMKEYHIPTKMGCDVTEIEKEAVKEEYEAIMEDEALMEAKTEVEDEADIADNSNIVKDYIGQEESTPQEGYDENIASTIAPLIEDEVKNEEEVVMDDESQVEEIKADENVDEESPEESVEEDEIEHIIHLLNLKDNAYLKKIFGYFICNEECSHQIEAVLNRLLLKKGKGQNFIIIGDKKSGKTTLSKCYAKALYEQNLIKSPKVAKITATKLNRINLLEKMDVLVDGMIIVEEAGNLAHNTVEQILQASKNYEGRLLVSLEDEESKIEELLNREKALYDYFEHVIRIPKFQRNDKLGFVLCFLEDQDYKLSPEGKEILVNALEEIENNVQETEQLEVLFDFVKKAKNAADKRNKSLLLNIMQSRNLESNDLLYIEKEDFYE